MSVNLPSTSSGAVPSGEFLAGVPSVAGAYQGTTYDYVYQQPFELQHNNSVLLFPQVFNAYFCTSGQIPGFCNGVLKNVGSLSSISFSSEIYVSSGTVYFKAYVYNTHLEIEYNNPETYNLMSYASGDNSLLYGVKELHLTGGPTTFKFFQFGVESHSNPIATSNWDVHEFEVNYYSSGSWYYPPAKSVVYPDSWITYYIVGTTVYESRVGLAAYTGANVQNSGSDTVEWIYTGSTIATNSTLWSGSGSDTPYACQVSGRC